jgi:hypothetical protein
MWKSLIPTLHEKHSRVARKSSTITRTYHFSPSDRTRAGPTVSMWSSSLDSLVMTWFIGEWEAATIFPWQQGWHTKSFSNFNLGNPWIKSSELNLASKSKLKWPSLLCHFQISEEDPGTKHWGEPKEWEKLAQNTWPKGIIWQTRFI